MEFVQPGETSESPPGLSGKDPLSVVIAAELAGGKLELPVLPTVASDVIGSSLDDQSDATRLALMIQQDQSLAGHVLHVVNSPAYRGNIEIVALKQAIARLGLDRIREIALAASLGSGLFNPGKYQDLADNSWNLALAAGLWSKEVARNRRKNVEMAYLCGLMHNIGTPLVLQLLVAQDEENLEEERVRNILLQEVSAAGSLLAGEWHLPEAVAATTEFCFQPELATCQQNTVMIANAGIRIAEQMLLGTLGVDCVVAFDSIQLLNLYPEDVEDLLSCHDQITAAMEAMRA